MRKIWPQTDMELERKNFLKAFSDALFVYFSFDIISELDRW